MLGEPTNDLDTDMLAAMEDLLDTWPGTLLVVSHDRYFLERVTDQQYAILPDAEGAGHLHHLPGGVDEYLRRRAEADSGAAGAPTGSPTQASGAVASAARSSGALGGAERRTAEKELAALERRIEKLQRQIAADRERLATLDQTDYELLADETAKISALTESVDELEQRWLELGEVLDAG